ncbi:MAG TPA: DUF58 domain-containing protein [Thermoplasmata archaeon]|nr:DUF58 domain-containing protein [Thermoplasmata archaeon]
MNSGGDAPPRPGTAAAPIRWRMGAAIALSVGGTAVGMAFLWASPPAFLFALPLLLAPVAAYRLRPSPGLGVAVVGAYDPGLGRGTVRLRLAPSGRPIGRFSVELSPPAPLRVVGPNPVPWVDRPDAPPVEIALESPWPTVGPIGPPAIEWQDPLGFAAVPLPVSGEPPRFEQAPVGARYVGGLLVRRAAQKPGPRSTAWPAAQGEFQTVRPYAPGDALRQINWSASARWNRLLSNSFRAELPPDIVLALDVGPWGLPGSDDEVLLGVSRAAAHALATVISRERARLGLSLLEPFPRCLPLGAGRGHLRRAQEMIGSAVIGPVRPPIERYAISLGRVYPPRTLIVVLTPFAEPGMLAIGYLLRRQGLEPLIVSPSPQTLERRRLGPLSREGELGFRLLRLRRHREFGEAWDWSPTVDWEEFGSLAAIAAVFRRPQAWGGARRA